MIIVDEKKGNEWGAQLAHLGNSVGGSVGKEYDIRNEVGYCDASDKECLALVDLETRRARRENAPLFGDTQHLGLDLVAADAQGKIGGLSWLSTTWSLQQGRWMSGLPVASRSITTAASAA